MLVHHAEAGRDRIQRTGKTDRAAVDDDAAGIRSDQAEQDRHQGRFSGAVLPHHRVHGSRAQHEIDAVVGHDGAESLADPGQLNCGKRHPAVSGSTTTTAPEMIWSRTAATFSSTSG